MSAALDAGLAALAEGRMIVITGDRLRGGDIDYCLAARHVTPEAVNFMAGHGRGLICLAITQERAERLGIALINTGRHNQSGRPHGRSIEAKTGVSTGISAADRARTIAVAVAEESGAADLVSPGHVFPLITAPGGVTERPGAAEAAVELCRRAAAGDAAVICSIMRDDGEMARIDDIAQLLAAQGIPVVDLSELL
ncbi:3,4-dihydroxy-2-butanone 4-phosphate synthase [Novosphingobium kunmingense]|uniref:3,4-dihydroxy-2-butanone 4-phosphate synthase n=1 Tax=Novosphingobium kunmingense TaxID=1211806 RepID=A0A2N0I3X4_9SPHN|nr:3,4-dihydroxy-2-butanone-4-phosphate synthase [Novosphingobium kunmingense]PKB25902.1 3,4-dihydroxy-2-butanone 4-phosphate synthase [Novosphingobium kunmingense]